MPDLTCGREGTIKAHQARLPLIPGLGQSEPVRWGKDWGTLGRENKVGRKHTDIWKGMVLSSELDKQSAMKDLRREMARGEVGQINCDLLIMGLVHHYKALRLFYSWVLSRGMPPSDLQCGSSLWQLQRQWIGGWKNEGKNDWPWDCGNSPSGACGTRTTPPRQEE